MPARERRKLTDAAVARLRPRAREYAVWDRNVPGFGVRVRPTGGKTFVLLEETGGRTRRVSLGPVSTMTVDEARRNCHARRATPGPVKPARLARAVLLFREFVDGEWRVAHFDSYKPSTKRGVRTALGVHILPAFGSKELDRIAPRDVRRWFDSVSRPAPGSANYALGVLRQIFNFAIACGYIESNPTRGLKKNRRAPLTRFLSRDEIACLHEALDRQTRAGDRQQADIVRILLLTGCRRGEILGLRWSEVQDGMLVLGDSKTGPRRVPLNVQARRILERQPSNGERVRVSLAARSRQAARPRTPALVSGPA